MSTIAQPREGSVPAPRRMHSSNQTPTSSSRTSLDNTARSTTSSPNPTSAPAAAAPVKRNRAALREFYNIKKNAAPTLEITDSIDGDGAGKDYLHGYSEVPHSEMDADGFDADAYVARLAADSSLADLLRTYTRVLGETRALDAEKKALVYDNYSKLIAATETIRKMQANMDPLNPMASTLDPAIAQIYSQASSIREEMRAGVPPPEEQAARHAEVTRRERTRQLAKQVVETPARLRRLVEEGKREEAEKEWELPRRLLLVWKEKGLGGVADVQACLEEGDAALRVGNAEKEEEDEDEGNSRDSSEPGGS